MADRVAGLNKDVLRWARERAGLSVEDVAARLKRTNLLLPDEN
jgi:ribosome-binding protein aMBF1 (putative translation factor)